MKGNSLVVFLFSSLRKLLLVFFVVFFVTINPLEGVSLSKAAFDLNKMHAIELIRLHVPSSRKEAWLKAEKATWEPWLSNQSGFLNRQLFWDEEREEAMLLINWETRSQWKAIPQKEIAAIQKQFEEVSRKETGLDNGNPFPITYAGELIQQ